MRSFIRSMFITSLFFIVATSVKAQEKYDYAIVKYVPPGAVKPGVYLSMAGKTCEKIEVSKDDIKEGINDYSPLLNYVKKMNNEGWTVLNTVSEYSIITFILEKKHN